MTWNRFGTPHTVAPRGGYLATGLSSDNVTAARQWIARNRALLGVDATNLEVVTATGHSVLLRQTFGGVSAGRDGLIAVGVRDGRVAYVSSSLAQDANVTGARDMGAAAAVRAAARDADLTAGTVGNARERRGWTVLDASGLDRAAQARLVAVPTPRDGVRLAWETSLLEGDDGFASFVDAETGEVLVREGLVDHLADNPTWTVFPNSPPQDYASTDTRVRWCWLATTNCAMVLENPASLPWDMLTNATTPPFSTFTTRGNNAVAVHNWNSNNSRSLGTETATPKTDREYTYPWTNQWLEERCNPAVFTTPERNDIDAARANLFAMHNRMHDWAYGLGFTEATWNLQTFNEATNWASLGSPILGKQVTVRLDERQAFDRIQVSAMLRTRIPTDPNDGGSQSRFSALRQFELLACDARGNVDCSQASQLSSVFTSPEDAFPSVVPRPRAPELNIRSFDVPRTRATHVRLRVLDNQCTGTPGYRGDQDDDPVNVTDCVDGSTQDDNVRAAELQLFR